MFMLHCNGLDNSTFINVGFLCLAPEKTPDFALAIAVMKCVQQRVGRAFPLEIDYEK